jgi:Uma2 family endonuclease
MLVQTVEIARSTLEDSGELIPGSSRRNPAGARLHGTVTADIDALLWKHVKHHDLGLVTSTETGFTVCRIPEALGVPDVAFFSEATIGRCKASGLTQAPDLAVLVLSSSDTWQAVEEKVRDYLGARGKLVWVVSPTMELVYIFAPRKPVRVLGCQDVIDGESVLPRFRVPVSAFFGSGG